MEFNVVGLNKSVKETFDEVMNNNQMSLTGREAIYSYFGDGLGRGGCLATIKASIKKDAVVFLHDIDGRESWYQWALDLWLKDYSIEYVYHNLIKLVPND